MDLEAYRRDGFVIVRRPEITRLKEQLSTALAARALAALAKEPEFCDALDTLRDRPLCDIIDHVVSRETERRVSGRFYRIFPATPQLVAAIADPFVLECVRALGLDAPVAGTLPIVRLDRPGDDWHRTPAHQDWWFSLLSPNCLTVWLHLGPLDSTIGWLEVVPGSHRSGVIPLRPNHDNNNPFRPAEDWPDDAFLPVPLRSDEILIFSQFLLHRSGFNRSSHTRLSVQLRYNDIATMARAESSFAVAHSAHVLQEQARLMADK
jgi:hypothetical protein